MFIEERQYVWILASALLFAVLSIFVYIVGSLPVMSYFSNPALSTLWSGFVLDTLHPPQPSAFFLLLIAFSFIVGLTTACAYSIFMNSVPGRSKLEKGICFGVLLFLVSGLPGGFNMFMLFNVPYAVLGPWIFEDLLIAVVGSIIMAELIR